jgi:hypothetical protein
LIHGDKPEEINHPRTPARGPSGSESARAARAAAGPAGGEGRVAGTRAAPMPLAASGGTVTVAAWHCD